MSGSVDGYASYWSPTLNVPEGAGLLSPMVYDAQGDTARACETADRVTWTCTGTYLLSGLRRGQVHGLPHRTVPLMPVR